MKKIFVQSVGCGSRSLDAQRFRNYFSKNNHTIVNNPKNADMIVFVTCGYMKSACDLSMNMIKKFQEKYDAELIVAGCVPAIQTKQLAEIFKGKTIITEDLNQNPEKIDKLFPENKIKFKDIEDTNTTGNQNIKEMNPYQKIKNIFNQPHLRPSSFLVMANLIRCFSDKLMKSIFIKIFGEKSGIIYYYNLADLPVYIIRPSWGCNGNCSYCGIKKAVGRHMSKPLDLCLDEFRRGLKNGYKLFDISSQDTGQYGLDIGSNFPELLDRITEMEGDYKIIISGLNPVWLVKYIEELERIVKKDKILLMSCPFQSGSSRILKLMKRFHNTEKMRDAYKRMKKANPDLRLFPQIIIGFPTETMGDIGQTLTFIKEVNFDSGEIFLCSLLPDTEAIEIKPKLDDEEQLEGMRYVKKTLQKEGYCVKNRSRLSDAFIFYKKS